MIVRVSEESVPEEADRDDVRAAHRQLLGANERKCASEGAGAGA
jgi:hypothetical protein